MKKILITILVGLFSCQTPVINKDKNKNMNNTITTNTTSNITKVDKIENKSNFVGKNCISYNLGIPSVEKFDNQEIVIKPLYVEKSSTVKISPYLGKIKMSINQELLPFLGPYKIELKPENKIEIDNLEKNDRTGYCAIKIINNEKVFYNENIFYFFDGDFKAIFNNSCEYDYFKSKVSIIDNKGIFEGSHNFDIFQGKIDIKKEKIEIEKIESLLHEYNKYYIKDIKEIEFSSINALKTFLLFIKLTTQEPIFYRDFEINLTYWAEPT